jgi:hypothetical protein
MSVRAIAIRSGPRSILTALPVRVRRRTPPTAVRVRRRAGTRRSLHRQFADDRSLIGVKLILIGMVGLAMMAMEGPW